MNVPIDGGTARVEARGDGPPVLCLHAGICDRRMWGGLDPARWGRRLVAWDRRGFGEATSDDRPWSPVDDALAVADAVGAERAVWMGCSQGARIALDVALAHPERVEALILVAPAVTGAPEDDDGLDPEVLARYAALEAGADREALIAFETWFWLDGPHCAEGRVSDPAVRALVADMNRVHLARPPIGPARWPSSAWDRLEEVAVPVVLVWGALDAAPLVRRFAAMAARLPRAATVVFDGAAHLPCVECPAEFDARVARAHGGAGGAPARAW